MKDDKVVDDETLKTQWGDFKNALLHPFTVLLLVGALILIWLQHHTMTNVWFATFLTLVIGFMMGLAIRNFSKIYTHLQETRPIVRRGVMAIHRLGSLIENVRLLESRIAALQQKLAAENNVIPAVIQANLGEFQNFCLSIQLACFNSIEDWTSILPHPNIASLHAQVIASFLYDREKAMESVRALNEELTRLPDQSPQEIAALKSRIAVKEREVSLLDELLFNSRTEGMWSTFTPEQKDQVGSDEMTIRKCRVCGESYYTSTKNPDWLGWCEKCRSERKMPSL